MSTDLVNKEVPVHGSIRTAVAEYFRERILTGELAPGSLLPSTQELSVRYQTGAANIHHAMSTLVKEGLISRRPKIGTVVNELKQKLERVAVYIKEDLRHPQATFLRQLLALLEEELNRNGIECLLVNENREMSGWRQLKRLASTRRIQGAIMPGANRNHISGLRRMNIPFVCLSSANIDNRVATNRRHLIDYAFNSLKEQGCSSAGIICSYARPKVNCHPDEQDENAVQMDFHTSIEKTAEKYGIELKPEWSIIMPEEAKALDLYTRFAFEGFKKIWSAPEKPEGLFVYTDDLITGTLLAIMHEQVNVPRDLKLVMHHSREVAQICPVPCVFIENSVQETAAALVAQLLDLYNGKKVKPVIIDYHIKQHKGD